MSSLFYTWLKKDGPEAVLKFHKNKNVLDADIIFVLITQDGHHSLCTIVNPGSIVNRYKHDLLPEACLPVLLFMDSKAIHDAKEIGHNLRVWLNHLWVEDKREGATLLPSNVDMHRPFTTRKFLVVWSLNNLTVIHDAVPMQDNNNDCGIFVSCFAVGLLRIYEHCNGVTSTKTVDCSQLITYAPKFSFTQRDMVQFRMDMKTLIERLSSNYLSIKKLLPVQEDNGRSPEIIKTLPGVGSSSIVAAPSAHATPLVLNVHQVNLTGARQQKKHAKPRIHTPFRPDSSIAAKPAACQGHEQGRKQARRK
jgi:hypothetical protein